MLFFTPHTRAHISISFLLCTQRSHIGILIKALDMRKVPILDRRLLAHHPGNLTSHGVGGEMRVRSGNTSVCVASPVVTAKRWQWQVFFLFVWFFFLRPKKRLARKQDSERESFRPFCGRSRYGEAEHDATDDAEDRPGPANEESRTQFIPAFENRCRYSFIECGTWNATASALTSVSQLSGQKTLLWSGVHTGSRRWASRGLRSGRIGGFRHLLVLPRLTISLGLPLRMKFTPAKQAILALLPSLPPILVHFIPTRANTEPKKPRQMAAIIRPLHAWM